MAKTREPISRHGRLFGGDSMYQVLQAIADLGHHEFNAHQIALKIARHPSQVQKDIDRLVAIGVLEAVPGSGAAKPLKRRKSKLARAVFSLPALISGELGEYARVTATESTVRGQAPSSTP